MLVKQKTKKDTLFPTHIVEEEGRHSWNEINNIYNTASSSGHTTYVLLVWLFPYLKPLNIALLHKIVVPTWNWTKIAIIFDECVCIWRFLTADE